ncbi:MAG: hypothetical protein M3252_08785 [Actinomycetota bacterium]|nr:hypothetical protein [Actinomycetota bacterium]
MLEEISRAQVAWANRLAETIPFDEGDIRQALAVLRHLRIELERPKSSMETQSP